MGELKLEELEAQLNTHKSKDTTKGKKQEKSQEEKAKDFLKQKIPEGVDIEDVYLYGFYEYQNAYYFQIKEGVFTKMSNFVMEILYLIKSKENPKRIIRLTNEHGQTATLDLQIESLISLSKFHLAIESLGNFLFEGKEQHLNKLKKKLYLQEVDSTSIDYLGWQNKGFWAWGNGAYDGSRFQESNQYGIIQIGKENYFIPASSKMYEFSKDYQNDKRFVFTPSDINFQAWANLFLQVYDQKGIIGITYYVSAVFRDVVYNRTSFFPHLNLFGSPGSGKSTMAKSLMSMFGLSLEPLMLGGASTPKAFMRKFSQYSNSLIWLDEYKNNLTPKIYESIKNAYDGVGYERAKMSQDNRTTSTPVLSACILSGQDMPNTDPALFKRVITVNFDKHKWNVAPYDKLISYQSKGLGAITQELLKYRKKIEENFSRYFDITFDEWRRELGDREIEDRIMKNFIILFSVYRVLCEQGVAFPFSFKEISMFFKDSIIKQSTLTLKSSDVERFWNIVMHLLNQNKISEGREFKVKANEIYIRLNLIHPLYLEAYHRMYLSRGMDKSSLEYYLKISKGFKELKNPARIGGVVTSAWIFDLESTGFPMEENLLKNQNYKENRPIEEVPF